jgi:hypothetical protein
MYPVAVLGSQILVSDLLNVLNCIYTSCPQVKLPDGPFS